MGIAKDRSNHLKNHFIVTSKNARLLGNGELISRYKKLITKKTKITHPVLVEEVLHELETIKTVLADRGIEDEYTEQIAIPGLIPKKEEYQALVIRELREHSLRVLRLESLRHQLQQGFELVFPAAISSVYDNQVGSTGYSEFASKSEKAIIDAENKREAVENEINIIEQQVLLMDRALEQLSKLENDLIMNKFIKYKQEKQDSWLMDRMAVGRTKFYEMQNSALVTIAEALGIL